MSTTHTQQAAPPASAYSAVPKEQTEGYDIELGEVIMGNTDVGLSGENAQKMVHIGFIRKVYGLLTAQLALTAGIAYLCTLGDRTVFISAYGWLQWPLFFANMGLLFATYAVRKKSPINLVLLMTWTSVMALSMGAVAAVFVEQDQSNLLFEAAGITGVVFLSLTAFAFQSKIDFSFMRAGLYMSLNMILFFSVLSLFVGLTMPLVFSFFGTLLFSGYIIFDTSRLINRFEPDEYVDGAIQLYLDILNMFLYILRILSKLQGKK